MPTKAKQHFVPCVYLRHWSPTMNDSVYLYSKNNLSVGTLRNVSSVLYNRHTYTISYEDTFAFNYMPEVKNDFVDQTFCILKDYNVTPFNADGTLITVSSLQKSPELYDTLDNWVFIKNDGSNNMAPKNKIVNHIKEIRSYVLETTLDDFVEKKWNSILDDFLNNVNESLNTQTVNKDIIVKKELVEDLLSVMIIFICRNPIFDCLKILPNIEGLFKKIFLNNPEDDPDDIKETEKMIERQMRAAKLTEIYKALYGTNTGFFDSFFNAIKRRCQITLLHCKKESGSFITSDNPAFTHISHISAQNYNAIYFPLSPEYLLAIGNGSPQSIEKICVKNVTNCGLKKFNNIILNNSIEKIISDSKYLGYLL